MIFANPACDKDGFCEQKCSFNLLDLQFGDETDGPVSSSNDLIMIGTNVSLLDVEEKEQRKENGERRGKRSNIIFGETIYLSSNSK